MNLVWRSLALFIGFLSLSPSYAAGSKVPLDHVDIDLADQPSLQRGAQTFVNYCLSCHSAVYMRYNRIGKDLAMSDQEVKDKLILGNDKIGDPMTNAMLADDAKKWFGVVPPDLSVISRSKGTDWLYSYLRSFYLDASSPMGTNNLISKDIAMPHVMWQEQGYMIRNPYNELSPITPANKTENYDLVIRDLVNFMAYMGEPSKIQRLAIAPWVLLYLAVFFILSFALKKAYWKDIH